MIYTILGINFPSGTALSLRVLLMIFSLIYLSNEMVAYDNRMSQGQRQVRLK